MTYLRVLQEEIAQWSQDNFPKRTSDRNLFGVTEKLGELAEHTLELVVPILHVFRQMGKCCHGNLKRSFGLRDSQEFHEEKIKDAIGDMTIYLIEFCTLNGWDYQAILEDVWKEVRKRDWIDDPSMGLKRYQGQDEH